MNNQDQCNTVLWSHKQFTNIKKSSQQTNDAVVFLVILLIY